MNRKSLIQWYLLTLVLALPLIGISQGRFYTKTDAREVLTNSYIQLEFVLENAKGTQFTPPDFSPFKVVAGPSTSSQISIINGRRTEKKGYVYTLLASQEGVFLIGSASIKVGRNTLKTEPLEIRVIKKGQSTNGSEPVDDVFIRAEISDSVVYPGQQVLLRYVLYAKKRVTSYNYLSNPEYDGFFVQEINTRDQAERRVINGVEYQTQPFQTLALFPQKLGDLYIEPAQFSLGIAQRNDPFSMFNRSRQIPVTTNDNWIRVIALPEGAPSSFNGAIGKFEMSARLSNRQVTTDDALSLKLMIEGNGLAKFIEAPVLDLGDQFDVYDPKVLDESIYATNDDIVSKKTFEYLLVPKKEGQQKFQVDFTYFDTDSSQYQTLKSAEFVVMIKPGQNALSGMSPEKVLEKYQLRPMMLDNRLHKGNRMFYASPGFIVLITLLLLIIPGLLMYRNYQIRQGNIDPAELKKRRAAREAANRLSMAKDLLNKNDHMAFYKSISDAFAIYISDKFAIQTSDLSKENIASKLKGKQVAQHSIDSYLEILKQCEQALFGGVSSQANHEIYEKADQLMQKMMIDLENR